MVMVMEMEMEMDSIKRSIGGGLQQRIYKRLLSEAENGAPSIDDKAALIINSGGTASGDLYKPSAYLSLTDYSFKDIRS